MSNKNSIGVFLKDSVWSILALGIMNMVMQLLLYPTLRRMLGSEQYGNVLYIVGTINIIATSTGSACNLARLVSSVKGNTRNADSLLWLFAVAILTLPICWGILSLAGLYGGIGQLLLVWVLANATVWRYYADVEYRLNTNYKGYFIYYMFVSAGYLLGIALYRLTGLWQLILLPGELGGLVYVLWKGSILRWDSVSSRDGFKTFLHIVLNLMLAQLLVNVVLNADRLVLKPLLGGEAVTLYYVASLIGKMLALISTPLNSVLIGHLAKSKASMMGKRFLKLSALGVAACVLLCVVCVVGSHIFVRLFYPDDYEAARGLFILANLAQIIYFAVGVLTTILLRYIPDRFQVVINTAYVFVFIAVTITFTKLWGLYGFASGLLVTNTFRYVFTALLGTVEINKANKQTEEAGA